MWTHHGFSKVNRYHHGGAWAEEGVLTLSNAPESIRHPEIYNQM